MFCWVQIVPQPASLSLILQLICRLHQLPHIAFRAWSCMWWCICQNFSSHGSCLFHRPLKKLEHCGICSQSRPRSHLRQVYFARYCLTFSKSCRAQKNRVDIAELLPQLSCPPLSARNALREQQLTHSGYSVLLCNALLWASTKYDLSCIILHMMMQWSVGSIWSQVWLARRCWSWKTLQRASLSWSSPCSRAWKASVCMS